MSISFELPAGIEQHLRRELGDLNQIAKEAALVELYRNGKLTHHQLGIALGLDRLETEALLKRHNVTEDCISSDALREQVDSLRKLIGA
jgi:hypothetical protein